MKFFLPVATDEQMAEETYAGIKRFMTEHHSFKVSPARIRSITYRHNGGILTETVGERSSANGEIIIAILDADGLYLITTPTRGVLGGEPVLAGKHVTTSVELFDTADHS